MTTVSIPDDTPATGPCRLHRTGAALDEAAVVRLRTRADGLVGAWVVTGFDVPPRGLWPARYNRPISPAPQTSCAGVWNPGRNRACLIPDIPWTRPGEPCCHRRPASFTSTMFPPRRWPNSPVAEPNSPGSIPGRPARRLRCSIRRCCASARRSAKWGAGAVSVGFVGNGFRARAGVRFGDRGGSGADHAELAAHRRPIRIGVPTAG